jgi:hypothetical protein
MLLRAGHPALAAQQTTANLRICEANGWNEDVARCHLLLASSALAGGRLDDAEAETILAEPVFHSGQMLRELAQLNVIAGQVALARGQADEGVRRATGALALAQPRGMRLIHNDALVLRGQARLLEASPRGDAKGGACAPTDPLFRALDDAEEGWRIARECGYRWGERGALFLQAGIHIALSVAYGAVDGNEGIVTRHRADAQRARQEAEALAARLRLTEDELAEADARAAECLVEWNAKAAADR